MAAASLVPRPHSDRGPWDPAWSEMGLAQLVAPALGGHDPPTHFAVARRSIAQNGCFGNSGQASFVGMLGVLFILLLPFLVYLVMTVVNQTSSTATCHHCRGCVVANKRPGSPALLPRCFSSARARTIVGLNETGTIYAEIMNESSQALTSRILCQRCQRCDRLVGQIILHRKRRAAALGGSNYSREETIMKETSSLQQAKNPFRSNAMEARKPSTMTSHADLTIHCPRMPSTVLLQPCHVPLICGCFTEPHLHRISLAERRAGLSLALPDFTGNVLRCSH